MKPDKYLTVFAGGAPAPPARVWDIYFLRYLSGFTVKWFDVKDCFYVKTCFDVKNFFETSKRFFKILFDVNIFVDFQYAIFLTSTIVLTAKHLLTTKNCWRGVILYICARDFRRAAALSLSPRSTPPTPRKQAIAMCINVNKVWLKIILVSCELHT